MRRLRRLVGQCYGYDQRRPPTQPDYPRIRADRAPLGRSRPYVALGKVVFTSCEHIIALEPRGKGLLAITLRYPYEVRKEEEYFDDIPDEKKFRRTCCSWLPTSSKPNRDNLSRTNLRTNTKMR
jgi:hypothetical protein